MRYINKQIIIDVVLILLIIALGIVIRIPDNSSIGSAQVYNELTDSDCLYLSDPDSYLYSRKAREYSEDLSNFSFVNTRTEDYMMNPVSTRENGLVTNGLPLVAAIIYRILHLFSGISIETIVYYLNMIIASLAAIPAYLYIRRQTNVFGGTVAAILMVVSVPFLEHSVGGFFDTDAMLLTVPLCLMVCLSTSIYSEERLKKNIYLGLAVFFFALLAATWETFYIYFGFIVIFSIVTVIELKFVKGKDGRLPREKVGLDALYILLSVILMMLIAFFMYGGTIVDSVRRLVTNMLVTNSYPDPTKYIVELSDIPVLENGIEGALLTTGSGIINKLGGVVIIAFAVFSIVLIFLNRKRLTTKFIACNVGYIAVWFVITLPLLVVGVRFLQLVCIPLALLAGLGVGLLSDMIISKINNKIAGYILTVFLCILILFGPVVGVLLRKNNPSPFYNKTFDKACTWVNNYASENASVMTWWDYGYFIQYASARHVLADGGTFDGKYFFFLGHALLTDDPSLSAAIFNMLDFSGVDSVDVAEKYLPDSETAAEALLNILPMEKELGMTYLVTKYNISPEEAKEIVTTAKPDVKDERYLFISRDMIAKIGALSYYGLYDFENEDYNVSLGVSTDPTVPAFFSEKVGIRGIDGLSVVIKKDENNDYVSLVDEDGNSLDIARIIYVENGVKIKDDKKGSKGYTLYCINDNGEYSFIVCSANIADSMLVSLMAFNGNSNYERVYASVLGDNMTGADSVTARFFGDNDTPENAGVLVYKVK